MGTPASAGRPDRNRPKQRRRAGADAPRDGQGGIRLWRSRVRAGGNIVGRDLYVFNVPIPAWLVAVVVALAIGAVAAPHLAQYLPEGPMPAGHFNVALARFGQIDDGGPVAASADADSLTRALVNTVEAELAAAPEFRRFVRVRHRDVGLVAGATDAEREAAARAIADRVNAHLVVFGYVKRERDRSDVIPQFLVTRLPEAEELTGTNRLGSALPGNVVLPGSIEGEQLTARIRALSLFIRGLGHFTAGSHGVAVGLFESATQVSGWEDRQGKEVAHLFLGTALRKRDDPGDVERARQAYARALEINPGYARAYIGLGNVAYAEAVRSDPVDEAKLDAAISEYERARSAQDKPDSAHVDAKVHVGLGNAYLVVARALRARDAEAWRESYARAEAEYLQVTSEYERGDVALAPLAAGAYHGLGLVHEEWTRDLYRARDYHRLAGETPDADEQVRQQARAALDAVEGELQRGGGAR